MTSGISSPVKKRDPTTRDRQCHRRCLSLLLQMTTYTVTYITQNVAQKKTVWEEKLNSSALAGALALPRHLPNIHQPRGHSAEICHG
jgi:hypothetical protein